MFVILKEAMHSFLGLAGFRLVRFPYPSSARDRKELRRLERSADFTITSTDILGKPLTLVSNRTFVTIYREIFSREIYRFRTARPSPYILDCGANIGISVIYFKKLFPNSNIVCFEPDPITFEALTKNVAVHASNGVVAINKAVWDKATTIAFQHDPQSTASRIVDGPMSTSVSVETVRLRDYLDQPVDFLKIDIEGAESTVLLDIQDHLQFVQNIFIEFHAIDPPGPSLANLLAILEAAGFVLLIENGCPLPRSPFVEKRHHKGFRLLLNIYGTRA